MNNVFGIPGPIIVPDGTELHEIIGPRILSELGLRSNDGISVALGKLPAGIVSKVHVHPVVWHFTWVRKGELTVKMKDTESNKPYKLTLSKDHGVLTEAGTFFQLINGSDKECEVYYIVGPAFVFELSEGSVRYNDAVVFDQSWEQLEELNWEPPELPSHWKMHADRMVSLYRSAPEAGLATVNFHRWMLINGPGSVAVASPLHGKLVALSENPVGKPLNPSRVNSPSDLIITMVDEFTTFLKDDFALQIEPNFSLRIRGIVESKCTTEPSIYCEYEKAGSLYKLAKNYVSPNEVWHLLLFGKHVELGNEENPSILLLIRHHVFNEILRYAVTIGGGFKTVGTMENYRAFHGGTYTNPDSYRHYKLEEER